MTEPKKLPRKLSDVIDVALKDLAWVERHPKTYTVDMGGWHEVYDEICAVCFAGAVMAKTLATDPKRDAVPDSFDKYTESRLSDLNFLRMGGLQSLSTISAHARRKLPAFIPMPPYGHSLKKRHAFKFAIRRVQTMLREVGA